jgi:hypothetical protein
LKNRFKNPIFVNPPQGPNAIKQIFATDPYHLNSKTSRSNQAHTPRRLNSSTHLFTARFLLFSSTGNSGSEVNRFAGKSGQVALAGNRNLSTQNFWGIEESADARGKKTTCSEFTGRLCRLDTDVWPVIRCSPLDEEQPRIWPIGAPDGARI